ncbi:MAG: type IV toxin-antitoxin system AbiEi family antitoxin domain-containing protein, partial [Acidimicrobiales bacterium]
MESKAVRMVHDVASAQGGLFTAAQAAGVGIGAMALHRWALAGWVTSVRRGVYAFAG